MPALENNPRRLKQFLGLYRLRTYIAKQTGLLAVPEGRPATEAMTLEQLGKFTALELRWPSLLREAANDYEMLTRLELEALGSKPAESKWTRQLGIGEVLRAGLESNAANGGDTASKRQWSLANLDVRRLLRVSPYVGPLDSRIARSKATDAGAATLPEPPGTTSSSDLVASEPKVTKILDSPKVPFKAGQNADFIEIETRGLKGFNLVITAPQATYWRCGFVLAPEGYIRDGRVDVTIDQYFLFHICQGDANDPKRPTRLHFQIYQQGRSVEYQPFHSENPVPVHVTFGARDGHVDIGIGDKRYVTDLDPNYLRHLYVLAWADTQPPVRVPIELTRL